MNRRIAMTLTLLISTIQFSWNSHGQESPTRLRTWKSNTGASVDAQLIKVERGVAVLKTSTGRKINVRIDLLAEADMRLAMSESGWGRVWQDASGAHRIIADLVEIEKDVVVLEKTDASTVRVKLTSLSKADRKYAEDRRAGLSSLKSGQIVTAKVVGVSDGDTISVLINSREEKIRIDGIDCPELGQAFGRNAKTFTSKKCFGRPATIRFKERDKYQRWVGSVNVGNESLAVGLLNAGLAWHYTKYSTDKTLSTLESRARAGKVGLWAETGPVPPWEWRRWGPGEKRKWLDGQRELVKKARGPPVAKTNISPPSFTHWLNTSSNVRHNASCRWYKKTKRGRPCSVGDGKACGTCGG